MRSEEKQPLKDGERRKKDIMENMKHELCKQKGKLFGKRKGTEAGREDEEGKQGNI